jgi:hypothetical protein
MSVCMDIALTFLSASVGTVKNGQVFFFQIGGILEHHGTAYIVIGGLDLLICKSKRLQKAPFKIIVLFRCKAQSLQAFFAECILIEYKTDLKSGNGSSIQLFNFISNKSFLT